MPAPSEPSALVLSSSALVAVHDAQRALLSPSPPDHALGACCASLRRLFATPHAAARVARLPSDGAPLAGFSRCVRDLTLTKQDLRAEVVCSAQAEVSPAAAYFRAQGFEHVLYAHARTDGAWAGLYVAFGSASAPLFGAAGQQVMYLLLPALHTRAERAATTGPAPRPPRPRMPSVARLCHRLGLTEREAEVALLVAEGLTSKEIAARLAVSPNTIRRHSERVLEKLGLHARSGVALALLRTD